MADDPILEQTIALRDLALAEVQRLPAFVRYRALDDAVKAMGGLPNPDAPVVRPRFRLRALPNEHTAAPPAKRISQAEGAIALLREAGHPLLTADIVAGLPRVGATVGGENPEINVSSSLSRDSRIKSVRLGGRSMWWLSDEPLPKNESEPDSFDAFLGSDPSVHSNQEGGEGHAPDKS